MGVGTRSITGVVSSSAAASYSESKTVNKEDTPLFAQWVEFVAPVELMPVAFAADPLDHYLDGHGEICED